MRSDCLLFCFTGLWVHIMGPAQMLLISTSWHDNLKSQYANGL